MDEELDINNADSRRSIIYSRSTTFARNSQGQEVIRPIVALIHNYIIGSELSPITIMEIMFSDLYTDNEINAFLDFDAFKDAFLVDDKYTRDTFEKAGKDLTDSLRNPLVFKKLKGIVDKASEYKDILFPQLKRDPPPNNKVKITEYLIFLYIIECLIKERNIKLSPSDPDTMFKHRAVHQKADYENRLRNDGYNYQEIMVKVKEHLTQNCNSVFNW